MLNASTALAVFEQYALIMLTVYVFCMHKCLEKKKGWFFCNFDYWFCTKMRRMTVFKLLIFSKHRYSSGCFMCVGHARDKAGHVSWVSVQFS